MFIPTIQWDKGRVRLIDQSQLPHRKVWLYCLRPSCLWQAISQMKIRGAPALGIAAAFGVVLGIQHSKAKRIEQFERELNKVIQYLSCCRPTATNLFWALERMRRAFENSRDKDIPLLKKILLKEAKSILREDMNVCRRMAKVGSPLLKHGDRVLTICNAGGLATAGYGTALGIIYRAKEEGKRIRVYICETRPLLQGSRLTAWELRQNRIQATIICDDMAASVMAEGKVDKVLVGADRVTRCGDVANKIGTYSLAILAKFHHLPFYVASPLSTFDLTLNSGREIPIETRDQKEVTSLFGKPIAPKGVEAYNPAFDVTPAKLVTAIITEEGILRPPYKKVIAKLRRKVKTQNPPSPTFEVGQ